MTMNDHDETYGMLTVLVIRVLIVLAVICLDFSCNDSRVPGYRSHNLIFLCLLLTCLVLIVRILKNVKHEKTCSSIPARLEESI